MISKSLNSIEPTIDDRHLLDGIAAAAESDHLNRSLRSIEQVLRDRARQRDGARR